MVGVRVEIFLTRNLPFLSFCFCFVACFCRTHTFPKWKKLWRGSWLGFFPKVWFRCWKPSRVCGLALLKVRCQGFRNHKQLTLRKSSVHLIGCIMRGIFWDAAPRIKCRSFDLFPYLQPQVVCFLALSSDLARLVAHRCKLTWLRHQGLTGKVCHSLASIHLPKWYPTRFIGALSCYWMTLAKGCYLD